MKAVDNAWGNAQSKGEYGENEDNCEDENKNKKCKGRLQEDRSQREWENKGDSRRDIRVIKKMGGELEEEENKKGVR